MIPSFICGYDNERLSKRVTDDKNNLINRFGFDNVAVFTFDGSSHDSHQHFRIIDEVDKPFLENIIPLFLRKYGFEGQIVDDIIRQCTDSSVTAMSTYEVDGKTKILYEIDINGTTYSGHPTRTTLGNTLRTLSYVCYLIYKSFGL